MFVRNGYFPAFNIGPQNELQKLFKCNRSRLVINKKGDSKTSVEPNPLYQAFCLDKKYTVFDGDKLLLN